MKIIYFYKPISFLQIDLFNFLKLTIIKYDDIMNY